MKLVETMLDWIYPPKCILCEDLLPLNRPERDLCVNCLVDMPWIVPPVCSKCGKPIDVSVKVCSSCQGKRLQYEGGSVVFPYHTVRRAIAHFKFQEYKRDAIPLGSIMTKHITTYHNEMLHDIDVMLPVPMYLKKQRKRGFNQAELLAKEMEKGIQIPVLSGVLTRERDTIAQNGLDAKERRENVKDAFLIKDASLIEGKNILLIDDIFTTGATINQCAKACKEAGAEKVYFYALAGGSIEETSEI